MSEKKTPSFDCSAINRLTEDKESDILIAAIRSAYFVRLTATNIDEILATPKKKILATPKQIGRKRDALLSAVRTAPDGRGMHFPSSLRFRFSRERLPRAWKE